jgi:hypothetical protein
MFEGIARRSQFSFGRAGTGGVLGVGAIGFGARQRRRRGGLLLGIALISDFTSKFLFPALSGAALGTELTSGYKRLQASTQGHENEPSQPQMGCKV